MMKPKTRTTSIITLDTTLWFGKYQGCELWEILEKDPDYVRWLVEEADKELDNEAYEAFQKAMDR